MQQSRKFQCLKLYDKQMQHTASIYSLLWTIITYASYPRSLAGPVVLVALVVQQHNALTKGLVTTPFSCYMLENSDLSDLVKVIGGIAASALLVGRDVFHKASEVFIHSIFLTLDPQQSSPLYLVYFARQANVWPGRGAMLSGV